jgi:hypothetical protein
VQESGWTDASWFDLSNLKKVTKGVDPEKVSVSEDAEGQGDVPRVGIIGHVQRLVTAISEEDDDAVEAAIVSLSQRSRLLAPLSLLVGAFAMLFQGVKLLFTNWRLTAIQVIPALLIWASMLDLKIHVVRGRELNRTLGLIFILIVLVIAAVTAGAYYLNAVFAFAIASSEKPEIRPAFHQAGRHLRPILGWGFLIGLALGVSVAIVPRWGNWWFALSLGTVVAIMMLTYVTIPSRLVGIRSSYSRRDKLAATAVGGTVGAIVCSPPYLLGRAGIVLLGIRHLFVVGVVLIVIAVPLQTGAVTATKAVKFSAKLVSKPVS